MLRIVLHLWLSACTAHGAEERITLLSKEFVSPEALLTRLNAGDPKALAETFAISPLELVGAVAETRLYAVNMDQDPVLERVLVAQTSRFNVALILDLQGDKTWAILGRHYCCGLSTFPTELNRFVELRQTVEYGVTDLVIHNGGSQGSGVGQTHMSIHRIRDAKLIPVLDVVESRWNWTQSEEYRFAFPNLDGSAKGTPPTVVAHRAGPSTASSCIPYAWDNSLFAFRKVPPTPARCRNKAQ